MVNKVILIGNLGKDPELTYTASGVPVCRVSLATTERWTNRDGEKQESTEWHNLVFWRRQAEVANEYLRKGSRIYVEGRIRYRSFEGQDGVKRTYCDIEVQNMQMLSSRGEGGGGGAGGGAPRSKPQAAGGERGRPGGGKKSEGPAEGDTHYEPLPKQPGDGGFGPDDDLPF